MLDVYEVEWRIKVRGRGKGPIRTTMVAATSRAKARDRFRRDRPAAVIVRIGYKGRQ